MPIRPALPQQRSQLCLSSILTTLLLHMTRLSRIVMMRFGCVMISAHHLPAFAPISLLPPPSRWVRRPVELCPMAGCPTQLVCEASPWICTRSQPCAAQGVMGCAPCRFARDASQSMFAMRHQAP